MVHHINGYQKSIDAAVDDFVIEGDDVYLLIRIYGFEGEFINLIRFKDNLYCDIESRRFRGFK